MIHDLFNKYTIENEVTPFYMAISIKIITMIKGIQISTHICVLIE